MATNDEKGGILLELVLFAFVLVLFTAGALRIDAAWGRRFDRLVRERNEAIRAARRGSAGARPPEPPPHGR
jgi:hypothetical protein